MTTSAWDWNFAWLVLPTLLRATVYTILVTMLSFVGALTLGLPIALARLAPWRSLRLLVGGVAEFIRSTPILIQIYLLYFVLPRAGVVLPALITGVIVLSLHYAAYVSETYRAAIASVPTAQREACTALGMRNVHALLTVVLPQAFAAAIPSLGNHLVALFKETPLLSAIAIVELLQTAKLIGAETFRYTEPITMVGLVFLLLSLTSVGAVRAIETRMTRWRC